MIHLLGLQSGKFECSGNSINFEGTRMMWPSIILISYSGRN